MKRCYTIKKQKECFASSGPRTALFLNWSNDWHKKTSRNFLFSLKIVMSLSTAQTSCCSGCKDRQVLWVLSRSSYLSEHAKCVKESKQSKPGNSINPMWTVPIWAVPSALTGRYYISCVANAPDYFLNLYCYLKNKISPPFTHRRSWSVLHILKLHLWSKFCKVWNKDEA